MDQQWKNLILDHYKNPRHYGDIPAFRFQSEQHNRTCGDHVKVFAAIDDDRRSHFSFTGAGCSLCLASASLMMELVQDLDRDELQAVSDDFHRVWADGADPGSEEAWQALSGLREYPVRSRCVKLAWQALEEILGAWTSQSN